MFPIIAYFPDPENQWILESGKWKLKSMPRVRWHLSHWTRSPPRTPHHPPPQELVRSSAPSSSHSPRTTPPVIATTTTWNPFALIVMMRISSRFGSHAYSPAPAFAKSHRAPYPVLSPRLQRETAAQSSHAPATTHLCGDRAGMHPACQMLTSVQFDDQPCLRAQQVHLHLSPAVEGNRQFGIQPEPACRFRQRLQSSIEERLGRTRARSTPSAPESTFARRERRAWPAPHPRRRERAGGRWPHIRASTAGRPVAEPPPANPGPHCPAAKPCTPLPHIPGIADRTCASMGTFRSA